MSRATFNSLPNTAFSSRRAAALLLLAMALAPGASAYEKDIHFSATLAIALAEGWSPADARIIASADQGLDENKSTVAALEFDVLSSVPRMIDGEPYFVRGPIHQADKNFWLHCFSTVPDRLHQVDAGVMRTVGGHWQGYEAALKEDASAMKQPLPWVDSLVALGVSLHCLQDSQAHNNYGGRCPKDGRQSYPGSCYGHMKDSAMHQHRRLFRNASNPDHPAVRDEADLYSALDATRDILLKARRKRVAYLSPPPAVPGPVLTAADMRHLTKLLTNPKTLNLSDADRIQCNHEVIAAWLFDILASRKSGSTPKAQATNAVSKQCAAAFPSLFPKSERMLVPAPSYPQLTDKAEARRAGSGPYLTVDAKGAADLKVEEISHERRDCNSVECTYSYTVRVSNTSQFWSAAGYLLLGVVPLDDKRPAFGIKVPLDKVAPGAQTVIPAHTRGPRESGYIVYADIQPPPNQASDWRDANVHNDGGTCVFIEGKVVEKDMRPAAEERGRDDSPACRNSTKQKDQKNTAAGSGKLASLVP